jgi:hypothetical protein
VSREDRLVESIVRFARVVQVGIGVIVAPGIGRGGDFDDAITVLADLPFVVFSQIPSFAGGGRK